MDKAQKLFVGASSSSQSQADNACRQDAGLRVPGPTPVTIQGPMSSSCPVVGQRDEGRGCPVVGGDSQQVNPLNNMPAGSNVRSPQQDRDLGTSRIISSIPMAGNQQKPKHQDETASTGNWVYPSEQMFYNAMKRKGWNPEAGDMGSVVQIHNAVNERAWAMVMDWEKSAITSCGTQPVLKRFVGRPRDYSPKARLLNLMGYKLPFDRHDWYVQRCGREVRYVIDFYNAAPAPNMPVAMHLDVRPALDSPGALAERLLMQWRGITGAAGANRMQRS